MKLSKLIVISIFGLFIVFLVIIFSIFTFQRKLQIAPSKTIPTEKATSPIPKKQPILNLVADYQIPDNVVSIYLTDKYCFLGTTAPFFITLNISNPSQPVLVGETSVQDFRPDVGFYVLDNYLFVAGFRGVIIFDISNPAEPKSIGFYETIRFKGPAVTYVVNSMVGIDNFLFLGTSDGLLILDVSNPKKPFIIGSYKDFDVKNIYISNNYAYVTGEKSPYFYILDMTDKSKPFLVSKYDEALNPTVRIYIVGKTAYIIENVSTEKYVLKIFDVSDPAKIRLMGTYEEKWMLDVYVRDKFAYLATENGLSILDVSTPSQPIFIQKFSEEQGELFYRVSGIDNYIYSIVWSPTKFYTLRIFEIKD